MKSCIVLLVILFILFFINCICKQNIEKFNSCTKECEDKKTPLYGGESNFKTIQKDRNLIILTDVIKNFNKNYVEELNTNTLNKTLISNYKINSQKFNNFPVQETPNVKKYSCLEKCINSNIECVELNCNTGSYNQCTNNTNLQNYYCYCKAKDNCKLNKHLIEACNKCNNN